MASNFLLVNLGSISAGTCGNHWSKGIKKFHFICGHAQTFIIMATTFKDLIERPSETEKNFDPFTG